MESRAQGTPSGAWRTICQLLRAQGKNSGSIGECQALPPHLPGSIGECRALRTRLPADKNSCPHLLRTLVHACFSSLSGNTSGWRRAEWNNQLRPLRPFSSAPWYSPSLQALGVDRDGHSRGLGTVDREELDGSTGTRQPRLTSGTPVAGWACYGCPVLGKEGQGSTAPVRQPSMMRVYLK